MNKKLGFTLNNGFEIKPVVLDCCLGIKGFGPPGLFGETVNKEIDRENSTTVLKSITRHQKIGNFGSSIFSKNGWAMTDYGFPLPKKLCYLSIGNRSTVNSFGLTNDGFDHFLHHQDFYDDWLIPSIFLEFGSGCDSDLKRVKNDAKYMGNKLSLNYPNNGLKLGAVVLNLSCPNHGNIPNMTDHIVATVKFFKEEIAGIPVGIKLSYMQDISLAIELNNNVDIAFFQAINTIPFKTVFGEKAFSPLSHIGHGGVSGNAITNMALEYLISLRKAIPDAKIIGGGGICNLDDAIERSKCCDAIAMGILVNNNTPEANKIIRYFK
jgi:dihydroorotate dehydrogenase